jgi:hypothetical protein
MPAVDLDALQDRAERDALRQRGQQRSARESEIPVIALALAAPTEFERDAAPGIITVSGL